MEIPEKVYILKYLDFDELVFMDYVCLPSINNECVVGEALDVLKNLVRAELGESDR